jgi:hypothetical protein
MKLYFNGCSHTWGDDLSDPDSQAWPSLIAKQLDCDFVNDAVSGGTNDRIVYRAIKNIQNFDKFYIAWTYITRFTRYRSDNNHEVNFNPWLKHSLYGSSQEFTNYSQLHYTCWYNELYAFKIWLQNIILLQRLFESENKSYIMINANHNNLDRWIVPWQNFNSSVKPLLCFDLMNDQQLYDEHVEIQSLIQKINFTKFFGWGSWCITDLALNYPVGTTGHLLTQGHQAVADYILTTQSL